MIWRGSYVAITGASRAVASRARTMRPTTAPRGFRRAKVGTASSRAARACHSRRISGMALSTAVAMFPITLSSRGIPSLLADPGIENAVRQVDHQVQDQDYRGDEQDDGLEHDEIPVHDTVDQQSPHPGH